jgi:hypothetical protein
MMLTGYCKLDENVYKMKAAGRLLLRPAASLLKVNYLPRLDFVDGSVPC